MWINSGIIILCLLQATLTTQITAEKRHRRYLLFTPATQWGVFATVSIPLHPESLVSVAWFFEANYYNVDNATYFEPLLGDIGAPNIRRLRSVNDSRPILTRRRLYTFIEDMLERHGYPGLCLLRAICENASQFLHNGVLGDLLHLILTPTSSMSEDDIEDSYYEAEYWGLEKKCDNYSYLCPSNPIDKISMIL
ncbi:uncharacterized protein LOC123659098 [Melitaea cinxia]|uniref:uncharacterized protein LOC123659098 n=1 Tax=Melitaea cinxia TaxID=113334 RepID=UPI001E26EF2E|nr:uncharacterized protein LOC123659098 [Melitaea cinxia]